jgi:hypothetical protein
VSSTPAGWYDDGQGQQRWWDGAAWTLSVAGPMQTVPPGVPSGMQQLKERARGMVRTYTKGVADRVTEAARNAPAQLTAQHDPSRDDDAAWSGIGRPLSGIGAGRYKLTQHFLLLEKGTLSSRAEQVPTHEIVDVDFTQSIGQKALGVGTIVVHVRRATGATEVLHLEDIPNFREGVSALNRVSHEERERIVLRDRTRKKQVEYSGSPAMTTAVHLAVAPEASASNGTASLHDDLARLLAYRDTGVLTDDEFAAAKRKLLGL